MRQRIHSEVAKWASGNMKPIEKGQDIHDEVAKQAGGNMPIEKVGICIMKKDIVINNVLVATFAKCGLLAKLRAIYLNIS